MSVVPFTWPVGMGKRFHGVMDLRATQMRVFAPGEDRKRRRRRDPRRARQPGLRRALRRRVRARARTTSSCCATPRPVRRGRRSSPASRRRCSSARRSTTSACARCSTRWSTWRRRPARASAIQRTVAPDEPKFSGVVFKIQANMDPAHRDRIAFVRVASGHFERGMRLKVARSGKELRPEHGGELPVAAARAARRGLRRRHHRHPEPRRAAARRHADRRRGAAVHRPAVLRARDVPHRRGRRPAAHQAAARRA